MNKNVEVSIQTTVDYIDRQGRAFWSAVNDAIQQGKTVTAVFQSVGTDIDKSTLVMRTQDASGHPLFGPGDSTQLKINIGMRVDLPMQQAAPPAALAPPATPSITTVTTPIKPSPASIEKMRALWPELHSRAISTAAPDATVEQKWLTSWTNRVPCGSCRTKFQKILKETPPDFSSTDNYFAWTVAVHNAVNLDLSKPQVRVDDAKEIYASQTAAAPKNAASDKKEISPVRAI